MPCKTNVEFLEEAIEAGLQIVNIGDSVRPRNLHAAVIEGAVFGKNVDGDALTNPNNAPINDLPIDVFRTADKDKTAYGINWESEGIPRSGKCCAGHPV